MGRWVNYKRNIVQHVALAVYCKARTDCCQHTMFYTNSNLDRADHLRKDAEHLKQLRNASTTRLIPVKNGKSLVAADATAPVALMLKADAHQADIEVFLGLVDSQAYFAIDVSTMSDSEAHALALIATDAQGQQQPGLFSDLRHIGPLMPAQEGSMLAYARGLIYWNSHTTHCSRCGNTLKSVNGGHVRACTHCEHMAFPRTDPAVIMLVTHQPTNGPEICLLGRSPAFPEGVYSTLAGFVEPGESLEMAVQREVLEEASIKTTDVQYVASQPWPFPRSIMLGFHARATTTDIHCDPIELEDAQWFTKEQLLTFGNWADETEGYKLPRTDSIARYLIDLWLAGESGRFNRSTQHTH